MYERASLWLPARRRPWWRGCGVTMSSTSAAGCRAGGVGGVSPLGGSASSQAPTHHHHLCHRCQGSQYVSGMPMPWSTTSCTWLSGAYQVKNQIESFRGETDYDIASYMASSWGKQGNMVLKNIVLENSRISRMPHYINDLMYYYLF